MPVYQYQCKNCEQIFEKLMSYKDYDNFKKTEPCENCGTVGKLETYFTPENCPKAVFSFMGSSIQSKAPSQFKEKLQMIKAQYGSTGRVKGIE